MMKATTLFAELPHADMKQMLLGHWGTTQLKNKLIEHKQHIEGYGEDLRKIRNWKWGSWE